MKFLCDQCKAKYQIDDTKVAGKTVRMKCRKCGHVIEIRAAVTESSQTTKERSMSLGQQPGIAAPPRRPNAPPPARPSAAPNALSSAFQKNVAAEQSHSSQPPPADPASDDEWYVAINGVPVGPIGMSELRRKAASGSVTETSLAWREGLEEWRVVRAIPELASLLRETTGSLRPPPGATTRGSVRPPAPRDPGPSLSASRPPPPRNNVIPLRGGPGDRGSVSPAAASMGGAAVGAAAMLEDLQASDPFAAPSAPMATADPFALPPPAAAPQVNPATGPAFAPAAALGQSGHRASTASLMPLSPAKKPTPWGPIAMVAAAVAFGMAGGLAFFINRNQQVVQLPGTVQTIIVQVPGAPATGTSTTTDPVASASAPTKGAGGAVAAGPKATASASASTGGAANLAGLLGGGPAGPSGGGGGGGGGGSSLTQQDIENTVRNYQPGVKRRCWDSAQQTSSVNVMASVTVGGDGSVQSVSASGNDPTIARCIETQIRGWRFPPTGGKSQFNVPFKFVRQ